VYIIDEVHMLSLSAFNALLKSLEEPPPHTVFILATTEPHKIPDTVMSRCQRHDLRALPISVISECLMEIAEREKFSIEPSAIKIVAKLAEGSMRDAQTLLERVRAYSGDTVTAQEVSTILGAVDLQLLYDLGEKIVGQDVSGALALVHAVFESGGDEAVFLREFVGFFRELHLATVTGAEQASSFGITSDEYEDLTRIAHGLDGNDLSDLADMAREGADRALRSSFPRYALESLVVRMASRPRVKDLGKMVGRLREMVATEKKKPSERPVVRKTPVTSSTQTQGERSEPISTVIGSAPTGSTGIHSTSIARKTVALSGKEAKREVRKVPIAPSESTSEVMEAEAQTPVSSIESRSVDSQKNEYAMADFVAYLYTQGGELIAEMLRCVTTVTFHDGLLRIEGPEFQVGSLRDETTVAKLQKLLEGFTGTSTWKIEAKSVTQVRGRTDQSLKAAEKHEIEKKIAEQKNRVLADDTVKRVIDIFPGSKIERIRLKQKSV
jgi:DNA polymerase-3 subunit gamma/tau